MTLPMKIDPKVPAYLQKTGLWGVGVAAAEGLSGGAPPRISYRAGRFRYVSGDGAVTDSTEHNGVALDVVIIGANEHLSKIYYSGAYDPASPENAAPDCYSDNGTAPSARAAQPQSPTCASCPHNAWGSKVTPSGSQVKACSDLKKLAVIPISNLQGSAFLLTVPAASLKGWKAVVKELMSRGYPVGALVMRVQFDTQASYPKLVFLPQRFLKEDEVGQFEELLGSPDIAELVGSDDVPAVPHEQRENVAAAAELARRAAPPAVVAQPISPTPQPTPVPPDMPAHTAAAVAVPPRKRGRSPKTETAAPYANSMPAAPPAQQDDGLSIPPFLQRRPVPAPQPVVQPATNEMDALLDGIMGTGGR